jgi:diguanylate cyclase (GGDEF)-like protein
MSSRNGATSDGPAPWVSRLPAPVTEQENLRTAWQVAVGMYVMAALSMLSVLSAPDPNTSDHGAVMAFAGIAVVLALVGGLAGPRRIVVRLGNLVGILYLSAFIALAHPLAATPIFYMWPILHSAYFFGRREVVFIWATMAITFAAALAFFHGDGMRQLLWTGTVLSLGVLAVVMVLLKERIDRLVAQLHESSSTDPLTGLLNRRAFATIFDSELERARRSGSPLTLAVFDLDHFKRINDRFGHEAGDRALCRFAELLCAEQRHGDPVARTGGEEFAVLLIGTDGRGAQRFAARIATSPKLITDEDGERLSVSAGLASYGEELQTQDDLQRAADASLYSAKSAGRHRIALHGDKITVMPIAASAPHGAPERPRTLSGDLTKAASPT